MTGFARAQGAAAGRRWAWEARSVNGRGLDLRLRLPPGYDRLDAPARGAAQKRFQRGSVTITLIVERAGEGPAPRINRARLAEYAALAREVAAETGAAPPRVDGLLALRGVIESGEDDLAAAAAAAQDAALLATLDSALAELARVRAGEGAATAAALVRELDAIAKLTREAAALAALQPATLKAALEARLNELATSLPAERLAAEVALLAAKGDVREELDRLAAHVAQARELLENGGAAGRKLEFLAQEFNREANTLCSKSADLALTRLGLELKTAIDRLREQAANLE
jgi:uncharacterized protein (TIGR00255 family)